MCRATTRPARYHPSQPFFLIRGRNVNPNNLEIWYVVAIVGGIVLLLAVLLYLRGGRTIKVPAVLTSGAGGAAVGLGVGIIWLAGLGYRTDPPEQPDSGPAAKAGMAKAGPGAPKMGGPPAGGGGGGGRGGPSPRTQLINLVNSLDTVVDHPVSVTLTAPDRDAIAAQLRGLDTAEQIGDDDARKRLDAILKVLEKDRKALEAVGFRWPGPAPKGGPPAPPPNAILESPNPFKAPQTAERLKSLQDRLEKK